MNVKAEWLPLDHILIEPCKLRLDYAHSCWPLHDSLSSLLFAQGMSSGGKRRERGDEGSPIHFPGPLHPRLYFVNRLTVAYGEADEEVVGDIGFCGYLPLKVSDRL